MRTFSARMAELVDALVSGTSGRKAVQVRVLFRAQNFQHIMFGSFFLIKTAVISLNILAIFTFSNCFMRIRKFVIYTILSLGLAACADIDALSDYARLTSFSVKSYTPAEWQWGTPVIDETARRVEIPAVGSIKQFPVTMDATITTDGYIAAILGDNLQHLTFSDIRATQQISLISQSGVPATYLISLRAIAVEEFKVTNYEIAAVASRGRIDNATHHVTVYAAQENTPITIMPEITLANGVRISGYTPGTPMVFTAAATQCSFNVVYPDETVEAWTVGLSIAPQLPNADLNQWFFAWGTPNADKEQPGLRKSEMFWSTTNDPLAGFGTIKIAGESFAANDFAAQLRTEEKGALGIRRYGAASLFSGFFEMDLTLLSTPDKMACMGKPFMLRPAAVQFSAQYVAGPKFTSGNPPDEIELPGVVDQGACRVRLEQWKDAGGHILYNYTPVNANEYNQITRTIVGSGELLISTTAAGWNNFTCPMNYDTDKLNMEVTHIVVNFTSSEGGAEFRVAVGSTLKIDNVKLVY